MECPTNLTKLYYSIGEVAEMFDVNPSLLRYWEKEFKVLKPHKNRRGDRRFTPKDIVMVHSIFELVKERGFTIEGAKLELDMRKKNPPAAAKQQATKSQIDVSTIKSNLVAVRNSLLSLKKSL